MADYSVTPTGSSTRVHETMEAFADMALWRNVFASHWEEIAQLVMPASRNTFYFNSFTFPGQKKTDRQMDSNGMRALARFSAIVDSLITPKNMTYHQLRPMVKELWKSRRVRLWFGETNRRLFEQRYLAQANFAAQQHNNYMNLGAFGTQGMFIDAFDPPAGGRPIGLRYRSVPMGELFIRENHQGLVDEFIRWFRMTPQQILKMFPGAGPEIEAKAAAGSWPMNVLHHVYLRRTDYDPEAFMMPQGKPWASCYVCPDSQTLLSEGGYYTFPLAVGRYIQTPGEVYGRSPAMMVLPSLKSLNLMKRDFLTLAHQKARPVILGYDDGLVSVNFQPGKYHAGAIGPGGEKLVDVLPSGDMKDALEAMAEEKSIIDDMFLVSLFRMLEETKEMTATEVIERINEKGILMAPTVGRQEGEYLGGGVVERELDIMSFQHLLEPMPPELEEAGGGFKVLSTSPLARAARAQEAAGAIRSMETIGQLCQLTGDNSPLDAFDLDEMTPGIAEIQMVPERWMSSPQKMKQKAAARAQAKRMEQQVQMAPAEAAMMNAQVKREQGMQGARPFTG